MKIFISYPHHERGTVSDIAGILEKNGHDVFYDAKIPIGVNWAKYIAEELAKADVVIIFFSNQHKSSHVMNEAYVANSRFLISKDGRPLIIPIVLGAVANDTLPPDLLGIQYYRIDGPQQVKQASETILFQINAFAAKEKKEADESKKAQERINDGIKTHIEGIIKKLETTAKRQKQHAGILYALSAIVLLITIGVAIHFLIKADITNAEIEKIAVVGIVYLFIAILVVSFSKFLFTLAKSFMVEAIRCSDRIHAISFGLFYLNAFDEKVTRDEVMKIFSNWNIDNGATSFRNQSSDDYDPRIHELLGLLRKPEE